MEQLTFGPYRLGKVLGRGGTGVVRSAYDTEDESEVALKILEERYSLDEAYRVRFEREAAITAQLRDPHVVPIHDFGTIDGRLFLGMRLIDGPDLATVIARAGKLGPERAVAIVEQVASALDAAHRDGLVHRDVKPSNVLVAADDFCYVLDFGVAHTAAASVGAPLTVAGGTAASLAYLAPERFVARPFDHRVDVYALACLLYEALTGRTPFAGASLPVLLNSHLNLPPPRPSDQVPGLPAALDDVISRGMAKDPDDRQPTAGALAAAAREALSDRVAVAVPSPPAPSPPALSPPDPPPAPILLPTTPPLPPPSPVRPSRRLSLSVMTLAAVVGIGTGVLTGPAAPIFEPVGHSAVGTFTPDQRTVAVTTAAPPGPPTGTPAAPRSPVGIPVAGDAGDLYGSPRGSAPCDRNALATYLTDRPELAERWSREANSDGRGPGRGGLESYFPTLTPVQLRSDTQLVEHGLEDGDVVSAPVVLQAGSVVLVDKLGLPRVRCLNGNLLTVPDPAGAARPPSGEPWPGYDPAATVSVTAAASPIAQFSVVDPAGTRFRRNSGSAGEADIDLVPATGDLTGTYSLVGQQGACNYNNCGTVRTLRLTLTVRDCDPHGDQCQVSGGIWDGTTPLRRDGPGWSFSVTKRRANWGTHKGVPVPTTVSATLTPVRSEVVAGVWRMVALGGTAVDAVPRAPGFRASSATYAVEVLRNTS